MWQGVGNILVFAGVLDKKFPTANNGLCAVGCVLVWAVFVCVCVCVCVSLSEGHCGLKMWDAGIVHGLRACRS